MNENKFTPKRVSTKEQEMNRKAQEVEKELDSSEFKDRFTQIPINASHIISTGSTLLDLAICGKRIRGGGIPGGVFVELFGPSQTGKTALLAEASISTQKKGGKVDYLDPEGRLDIEYTRSYGLDIKDENYYQPNTVKEMFGIIHNSKNFDPDHVNLTCGDSLAALSTELEMDNPEGDKMGMKRAKEFSAGFRKAARLLAQQNRILYCSNQIRDDEMGNASSTGGHAIGFYASIRIQLKQPGGKVANQITKTVTPTFIDVNGEKKAGKPIEKVIGIKCEATVIKSIDDPYRKAPLYIIFGYGVDDIRANLQYIKDMQRLTTYNAVDKTFARLEDAIRHIESENLEEQLRELTINTWEEIENKFQTDRKKRIRW